MASGVLFIGWGPVIHGREQKSFEIFNGAIQYYAQQQQQGNIESFEAFALEPHGGDLAGFLLVRGDPAKLEQLRSSQEFTVWNARAQMVVQNFGVVRAYTGDDLNSLFAQLQQVASEMG